MAWDINLVSCSQLSWLCSLQLLAHSQPTLWMGITRQIENLYTVRALLSNNQITGSLSILLSHNVMTQHHMDCYEERYFIPSHRGKIRS